MIRAAAYPHDVPVPSSRRRRIVGVRATLAGLARRFARLGRAPSDDLQQTGMEVACRRAPEYDPARGATFLSYVYPDARSAMRDANARERTRSMFEQEIARQSASRLECDEPPSSSRSRQRAERVAIGANAALTMHDEPSSPEDELIALEENERKRRQLAQALTQLDDVERMLIERVYYGGETIADVARAIGKTYKWTHRRYEGAMEKLRKAVR